MPTPDGSMTFEEIDQVMNPKSLLMGATGSGQLDVMMSSAEQAYQRARQECAQVKPLFRGDTVQAAVQQCMAIISGEQNIAKQFLANAEAYLNQRKARAEKTLKDAQVRPDISDELIVSRIHTLETLFDSLNKKDLLPRIEKELREGDPLSVYLLRNGEDWIRMYLESRIVLFTDLGNAILHTAGIVEDGLKKACTEYLTVENLITAFGEAKSSIENSFQKLPLEVLSWVPKSMSANALDDLPDDKPLTIGDLRRLNASRSGGGFFNQYL
jgi:hypothetical protein